MVIGCGLQFVRTLLEVGPFLGNDDRPALSFLVDDDDLDLLSHLGDIRELRSGNSSFGFVANVQKYRLVVYLDNSTGHELTVFDFIKRFEILVQHPLDFGFLFIHLFFFSHLISPDP